ncbi:MAG: DUF1801 domain-containing protein [Acidobacteria bacterium]|nr:DUF1801 domain-containing protein [Acidobacteriota bacterium]
MPKLHFSSVEEYLAAQPEAARTVLGQVRNALRHALPKADETISYNIPAYRLNGRLILYFAGWQKHFSLYPSSRELEAAFRKELANYEVSKGTIRFPLTGPVPLMLIKKIARFRAKEAGKVSAKTARPKKRTATT